MFGRNNVMSGAARRSFFPSLYAMIAAGYLISLGWSSVGFERPQIPPAFANWVDNAVPTIVKDINNQKGDINSIAVSHFSGDPSGYISEAIRLEAAKNTYVMDKSVLEKVYEIINLPQDSNPQPLTPERAVELGNYAKSVKAQGVIWGTVKKMNVNDGVVDAEIDYYLIGTDGKVIHQNVFNNQSFEKSDTQVDAKTTRSVQGIDWRTRLLFWALGVITFPLITINFLIATTAKRSNKANAFALIIYTLIDGIALYLVNTPDINNFYSVLFFICMILLAGVCNLLIMDFARKLKE